MYQRSVQDLNGIVLDPENKMSVDTIETLKNRFHFLLLARIYYKTAKHRYDELNLKTQIICSNDAYIYD